MVQTDEPNAATTLADICRRTLRQDGAAIRYQGRWTEWREIRDIAQRLQELLVRTGLASDAPVAFAPRNRPSALAAFLPLLIEQRTVQMVYPFQSSAALATSLAKLRVSAVVMDLQDFSPTVVASLREQGIAGIALEEDGCSLVDGLERGRQQQPDRSPALEILTSGTTGPPKHFPIGYDVVLDYVRQAELRPANAGPPTLLCFPLSNISGLYTLVSSFLRGQPVVLLERFAVEDWRDYVAKFRPSGGGGPPAALAMILAADIPPSDLASLHYFSTGAAPVDPVVQRRFEERYGIPVLQTYGATEFGGPVCAMTPQLRNDFGPAKSGSVGRPIEGARICIRDQSNGRLADAGTVGIVEVVSPRMGETWITTSDLGLIDADGFLFLHGRADGAIMRGGFKIVPEVVERTLLSHPAIAEASVVGIDDARLLQVPAAAIELRAGMARPSDDELDAHVRRSLPSTHIPAYWRIVPELPRTVSFKTDRQAVRALFQEMLSSPHR